MIPFKKVSISVIAAIAEGFQGEIVGRNIAVVDSCAVDFSVEVSNGEVNKGDGWVMEVVWVVVLDPSTPSFFLSDLVCSVKLIVFRLSISFLNKKTLSEVTINLTFQEVYSVR